MRRLLIADSGPLFSLAAGDLLDILSHLRVAITDTVKEETIDRGLIAGCSVEAQRLLAYYTRNARSITVYETQVGAMVRADRARDPSFKCGRFNHRRLCCLKMPGFSGTQPDWRGLSGLSVPVLSY